MLELLGTALVATWAISLFGLGALVTAVAGPQKLVVVAGMLLMTAASQGRSGDLDL